MTGSRSSISYFDRIFNKVNSENYNLSIRFRPDGLFYSFYDTLAGKYIGFESVLIPTASEMYDYIKSHSLLQLKYNKCKCIVPASHYTLVPTSLFIKESAKEYLQFLNLTDPTEEVKTFSVYTESAELVYSTNLAFIRFIDELFYNACIVPEVAAFIDLIFFRFKSINPSGLFLNLYSDTFDLLIMGQGKIKFCNNFTYKSAEDLVYYTIFVIDQLQLDVESSRLYLFGNITSKSEILKLLRKYIKTVKVLTEDRDTMMSYALSEIHQYQYPDLFNPRLCEL